LLSTSARSSDFGDIGSDEKLSTFPSGLWLGCAGHIPALFFARVRRTSEIGVVLHDAGDALQAVSLADRHLRGA